METSSPRTAHSSSPGSSAPVQTRASGRAWRSWRSGPSVRISGPVVVVVEDLHWADSESSKALLSAVQRLDKDRVVVLITARPGYTSVGSASGLIPSGCSCLPVSVRRGGGCPPGGAAGADLTPYQAERLHSHTGGHPLYVRTLLSELSPAELQAPHGELPAPRSLTSAVTARLSETPEPARQLAAAMAVINQRAALSLVARIADVRSPVDPFEALLDTGFVRWDPRDPGSPVEFAHPLYRQAVYEDLSPRRRRDLHQAAANAFNATTALAHRVAAADGADEALADELETKALHDLELGYKVEAARNFQWSSALSVSGDEAQRRLVRRRVGVPGRGTGAERRSPPHRHRIAGSRAGAQPRAGPARVGGRSRREGATIPATSGRLRRSRRWIRRARHDGAGLGRAGGNPHCAGAAARGSCRGVAGTRAFLTPHLGRAARPHARRAGRGTPARRGRRSGPPAPAPPAPAGDVPGDEVDLLVVRATLALYAGLTHAALDDLRAVVALAQRGFIPVELARTHRQLGMALVIVGRMGRSARPGPDRPGHRRRRSSRHRASGVPWRPRHHPRLPGRPGTGGGARFGRG